MIPNLFNKYNRALRTQLNGIEESESLADLPSLIFSINNPLFFETLKLQIRGMTVTFASVQGRNEREIRLKNNLKKKLISYNRKWTKLL